MLFQWMLVCVYILFRSVGCPTWALVAVKLAAVVVDVPPGSTALLAGRGSGSPAATAVVFTRSPGDHALTSGDSTNRNHVLLRQMRSTKDPSHVAIHARPPIYANLSQQPWNRASFSCPGRVFGFGILPCSSFRILCAWLYGIMLIASWRCQAAHYVYLF